MQKAIKVKASIKGGKIEVPASIGATVVRVVGPPTYRGATEVIPSYMEQVLPTTDKLVRDDITIFPAPTEVLSTDHNGTFTPSDGHVGFYQVDVDVNPDLRPLSVSENGQYSPDDFDGYSDVTVDVEPNLTSLAVTENGLYLPESGVDGFDSVNVDVPVPEPVLQGKAVNPSETAQHVTADSGYDGLSAVDVGAIPSSYVGTGITRRSSSDLTASGNTVSVPSGYYAESGSKTVQTGTAGTPTASKSAVSNNAVTVTPSVSNSEGYISGGTKTGNAVTVSASELVSGTENIVANGTYDVVNKASAVVNVPSQAPVLDSLSVTENGTYTPASGVDGFNEVVVDVPTGGFPSYDDVVLPSEYQRVEYIESSGTQYIDLPYGFLPTDFVQIKSAIATSEGREKYMVVASQWNTNNNRFAMVGIANVWDKTVFGVAIGNVSTADGVMYGAFPNDGNIHEFVYRDGLFISPDINCACGFSAENGLIFGSETTNIRLFFGWNSPTKGKIAYLVHEKADGRKIALFACYRKSDGVIGMYDIENDVFYTNDGSGDFTKGQDI